MNSRTAAAAKIGYRHRRRGGALFDPSPDAGIQRRQHAGGDIRRVEMGDQVTERCAVHSWLGFRNYQIKLKPSYRRRPVSIACMDPGLAPG